LTTADDASLIAAENSPPVQFCLQPDDTFAVSNTLGTEESDDDSDVVQICLDGELHLYNTKQADYYGCRTVVLKLAEKPGPEELNCKPMADGVGFRIQVVSDSNSDYLVEMVDRGNPVLGGSGDYSQAEVFVSSTIRDGQIVLRSADGRAVYSDQDLGGSGDGPIYFDDMGVLPPIPRPSEHFTDQCSKTSTSNPTCTLYR
jgi:hypothetical protein